MSLAVTKFFNFTPHLPFRFEVELYTGSNGANGIKYAVQSVKISGVECNTTDAATYVGDGYRTIPIWNLASRTMTISFEETDDLSVIQIFDDIANSQRYGVPWVIGIRVTEFDVRFNEILSDRFYKCVLSTYDEPAFSRTGGPGIVTISATFNIMSEQPWNAENNMSVGAGVLDNTDDEGLIGKLNNVIDATTHQQPILKVLDAWSAEFQNAYKAGKENKAAEASKNGNQSNNTPPKDEIRQPHKETEATQEIEKTAAKNAGVSYMAIAMANGGEGQLKNDINYKQRKEITSKEIEKAKKLQKEFDKADFGKELSEFVNELSNKQYQLGGKCKDGDIANAKAIDCSGAASAWATRLGFDIDEKTAGATNGGLVKQLEAQGAANVGQDFSKLKRGDILNSVNDGHVMIFLGFDDDGSIMTAESVGSRGGVVRKWSAASVKNKGYIGIGIIDKAKTKKRK